MGASSDAEKVKNEANTLFKRAKYGAAIEKYTEAITLDPSMAVLYVNRAMAYRRKEDWAQVIADATTALQLQRDNVKALYLAGLGHLCMDGHVEASRFLSRALEAARETQDSIKDDIWRTLARAKYEKWEADSAARRARLAALRASAAHAQWPPPPSPQPRGEGEGGGEDEGMVGGEGEGTTGVGGGTGASGEDWEWLLAAAARHDEPVEVPSVFTCPLTMETFREPAITKYGSSYEHHVLMLHLQSNKWDPITRKPLTESDVVPNVALREAVRTYLDEHPWAWKELMAM